MAQTNDKEWENDERTIDDEWEEIPPRRLLHSSEREKYPRYFYLLLTLLFFMLTLALTVWGYRLVNDTYYSVFVSMAFGWTKE